MKRFLFSVLALVVAGCGIVHAAPEKEAAEGRDVMKRFAGAIVGVELVVTIRIKQGDREAPPQERRIDVQGTVISESGLTVTTLAAVDPQATFEAMRASGGSRGVDIVGSEFKEVKLRLADGREVPARFVLKDADLDLAFMAPETNDPAVKFPHVKLEEAADGTVLRSFFNVWRAPKTLQRVPLVRHLEVIGIVEKPRRFYLLMDPVPGTPVFDPQGKILGVTVQHFANGQRTGSVVLPAADVADMAKQAAQAQAKAAEPAPAAKSQ